MKIGGFTLIELSIVLVIIGLIVGGVLVGRDLIRAAELRGTVSQVDKYTAAVNTFRLKYGFYPGDIPANVAAQVGIFTFTGVNAGTVGFGNGDNKIQGLSNNRYRGESLVFWKHLSETNLIDGNYFSTAASTIDPATGYVTSTSLAADMFPKSKAGGNAYVILGYAAVAFSNNPTGYNAYNLFRLDPLVSADTSGAGTYGTATSGGFTPAEAYDIDVKFDDGLPSVGWVEMSGFGVNKWLLTPTAGYCATGGSALWDVVNIYNTTVASSITSCYLFFGNRIKS